MMLVEDSKSDNEPPKKKFCYSSKNDDYLHMIPSVHIISGYKQIQAESNAALALLNKTPDVRSTLHYDTTSQNSTDGKTIYHSFICWWQRICYMAFAPLHLKRNSRSHSYLCTCGNTQNNFLLLFLLLKGTIFILDLFERRPML